MLVLCSQYHFSICTFKAGTLRHIISLLVGLIFSSLLGLHLLGPKQMNSEPLSVLVLVFELLLIFHLKLEDCCLTQGQPLEFYWGLICFQPHDFLFFWDRFRPLQGLFRSEAMNRHWDQSFPIFFCFSRFRCFFFCLITILVGQTDSICLT